MAKMLVAGIGNKYMGDDSFGPRVIEELEARDLPDEVEARDVGLCSWPFALELSEYEWVIFIDAVEKIRSPELAQRGLRIVQWYRTIIFHTVVGG